MGYFDLPRGEFELLLKKKGRGRFKPEWKCVMMTDRLYPEEIADCVEKWSEKYKVMSARYNGKDIEIPNGYHWEHRINNEVVGKYEMRKEAKAAVDKRKEQNWGKQKSERLPVGTIVYVRD